VRSGLSGVARNHSKRMTKYIATVHTFTVVLAVATALGGTQAALRSHDRQSNSRSVQQRVTVPLHVEFNRPFIDLEFKRPNGSSRMARFWVDTGGGAFIICEPLARELDLKFGPESAEEGRRFAATNPPKGTLGGMPLDLEGARAIIAIGEKTIHPGVSAEGLMPGHVLKRYHVVFDYPGKQFTLATPGSLKPRGARLASPIQQRNGFPRIEAQIDGQNYGFLLDTGASFTMISQELLNQWSGKHPDWQRTVGAVGAANMGLGGMEAGATMMRIPSVKLGEFQLPSITAVSRSPGTFEKAMSSMMTSPIIGAIGGNVLKSFRVEIDYANGVTYLEKRGDPDNALDIVGLTLRPQRDGTYVVSGVSKENSAEVIRAIKEGDKLIRVDKLEVLGAPFADVVNSLRGAPKQVRVLVLEREGRQFTVKAPAVRIM
jgi:predicted aspartyl protease